MKEPIKIGRLNQIGGEAMIIKLSNGFKSADWDNPIQISSKIVLIHSELSEAVEEVRVGEKEKFHVELIDVVIRTLELLAETGADIDMLVEAKMKENAQREWKHGNKRF